MAMNEESPFQQLFKGMSDGGTPAGPEMHAEHYKKAQQYIPCGAQTLSKSYKYGHHSPYFPSHIIAGHGSKLAGTDGKEYLDFICGLGSVSLGYGYGMNDIIPLIAHGTTFSVAHFAEPTLAEALVNRIPCAEQVRFVSTGSEACQAAVRIARCVTGKKRIIVVGYHGWHMWFAASRPEEESPGIPEEYRWVIQSVQYNDILGIREALKQHDVAAVILEPTRDMRPEDRYLETVRTFTKHYEALLIFDEMLCGYRWALAGGQEYFHVVPDLAVFGKGMGNGAPIGCVVGPAEFMSHVTFCSGTFSGNSFGLISSLMVIKEYEENNVIRHMWQVGAEFQARFNNMVKKYDIGAEVRCEGYPVHPVFVGNPKTIQQVVDGLAKRQVLVHPKGCNIMLSHDENDLMLMTEALGETLKEIKDV